jgi:hypothetical protein
MEARKKVRRQYQPANRWEYRRYIEFTQTLPLGGRGNFFIEGEVEDKWKRYALCLPARSRFGEGRLHAR